MARRECAMAALFPAERIGGLASLQPATLRLAADVRYGSKTSGNSSPKLRAGACRSVVIFSALVGSLVRSMRTAIKVAVGTGYTIDTRCCRSSLISGSIRYSAIL